MAYSSQLWVQLEFPEENKEFNIMSEEPIWGTAELEASKLIGWKENHDAYSLCHWTRVKKKHKPTLSIDTNQEGKKKKKRIFVQGKINK